MANIINTSFVVDPNIQQPLLSTHLEFLQTNVKTMDNALINALSNNNLYAKQPILIDGCDLYNTGSTSNILQGYIYDNVSDEIYFVPETHFGTIIPSSAITFSATTSYSSNYDPTEFTDGNFYNVAQIKTLTPYSGNTGLFQLSDIAPIRGKWFKFGSTFNSWTGSTTSSSRLNSVSNRVELAGSITNIWNNMNTVAYTLPIGQRPLTNTLVSCPSTVTASGTAFLNVIINIQTNGDMYVTKPAGYGTNDVFVLYMDSISFQVEK